MFKCVDCGEFFDEPMYWKEPHGEEMCGCPNCNGSFDRAFICEGCNEYFLEDELFEGYCEGCLTERIDYSVALEYFLDSVDGSYLVNFMFEKIMGIKEPSEINEKLLEMLQREYMRRVMSNKIHGTDDFLRMAQKYIMLDDGECGKQCFAEWYVARKDKK